MADLECPVAAAARSRRDALAIVTRDAHWTYRQYDAAVAAAAERLRELGVARGDTVALATRADADYLVLLNALFRAGVVACPLNTRLPEKALRACLDAVNCTKAIGGQAGALEGMAWLRPETLLGHATPRAAGGEARIDERQPATIVFTSGSSGAPKAALHAYGNHHHNAALSNRNIPLQAGDRWLLSLPLYHVAGLGILFRCALAGAAVAISEPGQALDESIGTLGATHASLVSTQLYRVLERPGGLEATRGLKAILLGGGPAAPALIRRAAAHGLPLHVSYGLTEMASQVTTTPAGAPVEALLTAGEPLEPDTVAISADGEILVRGAALFLGYRSGGALKRPLSRDGWFATGDLGRFDGAGRLVVAGRKDSRFVCGGENIQPEEIEGRLRAVADVRDAVVAPVEDAEFGQVAVAFVRMETGAPFDEKALIERLVRELPRFKMPRRLFEWPPEAPSGGIKTRRAAFAALARARIREVG